MVLVFNKLVDVYFRSCTLSVLYCSAMNYQNGMSVLVAIHDKHLRETFQTTLENDGFEVVVTGTGEDTLRALDIEKTFEIVYLDLRISKNDCWSTLNSMKNLALREKTKKLIILVDGPTEHLRDDELRRYGIDDMYTKTDFDPGSLITRSHLYADK